MARYYRRRYTRTLVRPKKKWASNIKIFSQESSGEGQYFTLVENSAQTGTPTPTIVKCGNFKVSIDAFVSYSQAVTTSPAASVFIMYIPEGWPLSNIAGAVTAHPEWIMGEKTVGGSFGTGSQVSLETLNMSTRMKRNLNSGDRVVLFFSFYNTSIGSIVLSGTVRYWTCAN